MSKPMTIKEQITQAHKDQGVVRVYREGLEDGWAHGYIVATGPVFFALELVDDGMRFDGINCMRYEDVSECKVPDPHWQFVEKALNLRGFTRAKDLNLDLSSIEKVLESAVMIAPLISIHLEVQDPHCCYIGCVREISGNELWMLGVTTDGEWEDEQYCYDLDQITRVDVGGAYVAALSIVAHAK